MGPLDEFEVVPSHATEARIIAHLGLDPATVIPGSVRYTQEVVFGDSGPYATTVTWRGSARTELSGGIESDEGA